MTAFNCNQLVIQAKPIGAYLNVHSCEHGTWKRLEDGLILASNIGLYGPDLVVEIFTGNADHSLYHCQQDYCFLAGGDVTVEYSDGVYWDYTYTPTSDYETKSPGYIRFNYPEKA